MQRPRLVRLLGGKLSDVREELDATRAADMRTTQVLREGVLPATGHPQARYFDGIALD